MVDKDIDNIMNRLLFNENNRRVCKRCNRSWISRSNERLPKLCKYCKSPFWNTPRRKDIIDYLIEFIK